MSKDFEISKLLDLSREKKYATTVAAFEVIDMLEQIDIPRKMANRKPAVKAMNALFEQTVQWDYIGDEAREALAAELENSRRANLDAVFGNAQDTAALAGSADAIGSEAFNTMAEGGEMEGFQSADGEDGTFGETDAAPVAASDSDSSDDDDDDDDSDDDSYDDDDDDDDRDFDFGDSPAE
ncbi:MAG: hypothetical protein RIF32_06405 [Leptospirales bacterium]|jgi:hypothetical protein